jgi:hypothetical protein
MCPELLAAAQEFDNQVILRREIAVQRHLRRAGPGDDGIHPDRPDTFTAEQLVRGPAHAFAPGVLSLSPGLVPRRPPVGHRHASSSLPRRPVVSIPSAPRPAPEPVRLSRAERIGRVVGQARNCCAGFVPPHRFPRGFPRLHHGINGRSASEVTAKLLVRTNVNGTRFTARRCPHCGHLVDPPGPAEDDPGVVLDSLRREISLLRETVAYLRGSLGSWARPGRLPVPCARHTSNGPGNLCPTAAVPSASYCETIVMQESATIRRRHEHYVGPQQAHFHIS